MGDVTLTGMIEGLIIQPLKVITDERGDILHMFRSDNAAFRSFGEIYFSKVNPAVVKAWKKHSEQTQNLAVPVGLVRLVVYDDREDSSTKGNVAIIEFGDKSYSLVTIPPLLWYGFKGLSETPSLIANCVDIPHSPEEAEKIPADNKNIPYCWD